MNVQGIFTASSPKAIVIGGGLVFFGLSLLLSFNFSKIKRSVRRRNVHQKLVAPYKKYSRVPYIVKYNYNGLMPTSGYLIKYHFYQGAFYKGNKDERSFYVFVPPVVYSNIKSNTQKYPVIFVFHGTNGRATRYSSLWQQPDGSQSLLELAEKENIILVFGNAGTWRESYRPTEYCSGWRPGGKDVAYVEQIIQFIMEDYPVDPTRIYAIGHSNGGMFISDLVVSLGHRFAAAVNHMGGMAFLPANADEDTKKIWKKDGHISVARATHKVPLMIITSHKDDNRRPCLAAKEEFEKNNWDVNFVMLEDIPHAYWAERTPQVWEFYQQHRLP